MLPAYVTAGVQIVTQAQTIFGGGKEGERLAANESAYQAAIAGDGNALAFLKQRSGDFGTAYVAGYGEIGGWATDSAQADARAKYQAALRVRGLEAVAEQVPGIVQGVAQATGNTVVPFTQQELVTFAVVAVVVVAVAALALRRRGRRG